MPLPGYGILYGTVVTVRAPRAKESHWLLVVQPNDPSHPTYRVAMQLADARIGIGAQWSDLTQGGQAARNVAKGLIAAFSGGNTPRNFLTAQDSITGGRTPGLDYVRSGIVDLNAFALTTSAESDPVTTEFVKRVRPEAKVVICGTGTPINPETSSAPNTGFTGVGNVHLNQGTRTWIANGDRYDENGANQDGALFVLDGSKVMGLFLKFKNQSVDTDSDGAPLDSGVASIDQVRDAAEPVVTTYLRARASEDADAAAQGKQQAQSDPQSAAAGFVFQDQAGSNLDDPFIADDDKAVINNPVAQAYAKGTMRAPEYIKGTQPLVMRLADVRGASFVNTITNSISFDLIGDSGAVTVPGSTGEHKVAAQMCSLSKDEPPAFCFHVGDVVYFYGEGNYFPCQFGVPFKDYPAPIFAIPGNHDACVYDDQHKPLDAFIEVFCADQPASTGVLGGVSRTTMTQPGVYFTLDAPLVSIVGLFSGAAETQRYMSTQQIQHFLSELLRLKQLRSQGAKRAIILAVHHLPQFYEGKPDAVSTGLDAACRSAGVWPDAVVVGHAHLYQRFVRAVEGQQIPYLTIGNGGYRIVPGQKARVDGQPNVSNNVVKNVLGFLRAKCDGQRLLFQAIDKDGQTIDQLGVDLTTKVDPEFETVV